MRHVSAALIFFIPALSLAASGPVALGGNGGKFGDWTAATYGSGAGEVCYAFVPAGKSKPAMHKRGLVLLTVTERAGAHDEVTVAAGFKYPANASVSLSVGTQKFDFYTQGATAFTTSGAAAVTAFKTGAGAEAVSTGPHGHKVTDDFSLVGFSGAYAAIKGACS
jgi:Invasion associated locus B (IalB) protein